MSRGKKPLIDPPVCKRISLPGSIVFEVEEILHDPVRGKVTYGAFGKLVAQLLAEWVEKKRKQKGELT